MLDAPKCDIQSQCMSQIQLGWDTYQIPLEGSCGHGGNCFGSVRIYGHFPDRAASVMREAAARRASRSKDGNSEADRTTKPSRSRASRAAL